MTTSVAVELKTLLGLEPIENEIRPEYAKRLALKANGIGDDAWAELSTEAQLWVNAAVEAIENKQMLPPLPGVEELLPVAAPADDAPEAPAPKSKSKKAPAKKAAAKKPAAKKAAPASKKAAAKPAKKGAKAASADNGVRRGPKGTFSAADKITIKAEGNPFRANTKSADWFAKYKNGMTVQAAIDAGVPRHHILWDKKLGNIEIGG